MKEITEDASLVAYCGLYCGACGAYIKGRCPGCHENKKATWCKIRSCCSSREYKSCADCAEFRNPNDCRFFNNLISKIFGLIFRSDRAAIRQIREKGIEADPADMAEKETAFRQKIKRLFENMEI